MRKKPVGETEDQSLRQKVNRGANWRLNYENISERKGELNCKLMTGLRNVAIATLGKAVSEEWWGQKPNWKRLMRK